MWDIKIVFDDDNDASATVSAAWTEPQGEFSYSIRTFIGNSGKIDSAAEYMKQFNIIVKERDEWQRKNKMNSEISSAFLEQLNKIDPQGVK